jgi:hypothetical protein
LELRRAEILLIQTGVKQWLGDLRKLFEKIGLNHKESDYKARLEADQEVAREMEEYRQSHFHEKSEEEAFLQQCTAIVYDAMRYLERCGEELRKHPKNRWWWWIYLVLRVHAAEALFVLRLMLPEKTSRIIQLDEFIKRVSLTDPFQLARILRSYRRLLFAQRLFLIRSGVESTKLDQSDKVYGAMYRRLCQHLSIAMTRRENFKKQGGVKLDDRVSFFVYSCLLDAQMTNLWEPSGDEERSRLKETEVELGRKEAAA